MPHDSDHPSRNPHKSIFDPQFTHSCEQQRSVSQDQWRDREEIDDAGQRNTPLKV
jgi:hypothetical protein